MNWTQWIGATASAGAGGAASLLIYIHSTFPTQDYIDHRLSQPHPESVQRRDYSRDRTELLHKLEKIDQKLDRLLLKPR